MITRAITGFFFVLIVLAAIYFGDFSTVGLCLLVGILGLDEFYKIAKLLKTSSDFALAFIFGIILLGILLLSETNIIPQKSLVAIVPMVLILFISELYNKRYNPFKNIAFSLLGWIYVLLPFYFLLKIGFFKHYQFTDEFNSEMLFAFFIFIWTYDTGAYLSGRFLGKHKLFERISPKKTWEGAIGGLLFAIAAAIIASNYFSSLSTIDWVVYAFISVVAATYGDLTESLFKRSAEIKDSGTILPGHGGILDRFDSVLFAAPAVYTYLILISQ